MTAAMTAGTCRPALRLRGGGLRRLDERQPRGLGGGPAVLREECGPAVCPRQALGLRHSRREWKKVIAICEELLCLEHIAIRYY